MVDMPRIDVGGVIQPITGFAERALSTVSPTVETGRDAVELVSDFVIRFGSLARVGINEVLPALDTRLDDDLVVALFGEPVTIMDAFVRLSVHNACVGVARVMRSNPPT